MSDKPMILVSGGAGYIGSHTCMALRQAGYHPVVLDSLVTGNEWTVKFGPLCKGDVGDTAFVRSICQEYRPAALVHFAAFIEVGESVKNPEKYFENNTAKASRLFDTAASLGVTNVVFSSTAAVYGAVTSSDPIREDLPLAPINPYGLSKLKAEEHLRGVSGMRSMILRYFNASGAASEEQIGEAHWPETHLIPNAVLASIMSDREMSVFGTDYPTKDGTAVRDYIHVQDLADAHVRAVTYLLNGGASDICNLGQGAGNSVQEVINVVERVTGKPVKRSIHPRRAGDPPFLVADASKAKKILGWHPTRTVDDIVRSAAAWHASEPYQKWLSAKKAEAYDPAIATEN